MIGIDLIDSKPNWGEQWHLRLLWKELNIFIIKQWSKPDNIKKIINLKD